MRLNEPLQDLLPAKLKVPTFKGNPVLVVHLATHTSGLRLLPGTKTMNKCSFTLLTSAVVETKPGEKYFYNNYAADLLGDTLVHVDGARDFDALVVKRICKPLGMQNTLVNPNARMLKKLAQGYRTPDTPAEWNLAYNPSGGTGAIRSTGNDMLKFVSAYAGVTKTNLDSAIRLSYVPNAHLRINEPRYRAVSDLGLFWNIEKRHRVIWKGGVIGGFFARVFVSPEHHAGVFVLTSRRGGVRPDALGRQLLDLLVKEDIEDGNTSGSEIESEENLRAH